MARPREHDGIVYWRPNTKILWMCYFDREGKRIRESTFEDWQEANKNSANDSRPRTIAFSRLSARAKRWSLKNG
jgi:hypothetical protein